MTRADVLIDLINKHDWRYGAELGLWDGRTFLKLLAACPKLHMVGVDFWQDSPGYTGTDKDGNVWNHNKHEVTVREAIKPNADRVTLLKMSTIEAANYVENGSLDFVFIDADHSTEGVLADIAAWQLKLKSNGTLLGHDINWPSVKEAVLKVYGDNYDVLPDNVWMAK